MTATLRLSYIDGASLTVLLDTITGDAAPVGATATSYLDGQYTAQFALVGVYCCRFYDAGNNLRFIGYVELIDGEVGEVVDLQRDLAVCSSVTGNRAVTITVQDDSLAVVPGVLVTIQDSLGNAIAGAAATTNGSGVVAFNLDDGNYQGRVSAGFGFVPHVAESFTVDEDGETVTLNVVRNTTPVTPSAAGLCAVQCYVFRNGDPVVGAKVQARVRNVNSAVSGIVLSTDFVSVVTDATGLAILELVRLDQFTDGDGIYQIEAFDGGARVWSTKTSIPNVSTITLEELIGT